MFFSSGSRNSKRAVIRVGLCDSWCVTKPAIRWILMRRKSDVDENDPNALVVVVQYVDVPSKSPLGPT